MGNRLRHLRKNLHRSTPYTPPKRSNPHEECSMGGSCQYALMVHNLRLGLGVALYTNG